MVPLRSTAAVDGFKFQSLECQAVVPSQATGFHQMFDSSSQGQALVDAAELKSGYGLALAYRWPVTTSAAPLLSAASTACTARLRSDVGFSFLI